MMSTDIENENETTASSDQIAAEQMLDRAIPDESASQNQTHSTAATSEPEISSLGLAALAINGVADLVQYQYPYLHYTEQVREEGVLKLAPVLEKYNIKSTFIEKWKVEFEFGAFMAGLIFTGYMQVKAHNQQAEKVVEPVKTDDLKPDESGKYSTDSPLGSTFKFASGG